MPLLLLRLIFYKVKDSPAPFFVKPIIKGIVKKVDDSFIDPQTKLHFDFIEAELSKRTWLAGEAMTVADIQMSFPLEAAASRFGWKDRYPKIDAYVARVHALPAYKRSRSTSPKTSAL